MTQTFAARFDVLASRLDVWGCSPDEIALMELDQGVTLPPSYRYFLAVMGRDAGGLFAGTSIAFAEVLGLRQMWIANEPETIPADAAVISDHQGYQCMYLRGEDGGDPPVWHLMEGHAPSIIATTLIDLFEGAADADRNGVSRQQAERHRRSTLAARRRTYVPEMCPGCGGALSFGGVIEFGPGRLDAGRARTVASCATCGQQFWRWADEPDAALRHI